MNSLKYISLIIIALISFSCNKKDSQNSTQEVSEVQNLKTIEVNIEGMTCEIGCAKLIESKTSKLEGITSANVDFEKKQGTFTYDANKITAQDITASISSIADGNLYKVTGITDL